MNAFSETKLHCSEINKQSECEGLSVLERIPQAINFIKKPLLSNLLGISQIKKMGKRLVVGDVEILSEDKKQIYAQALFTYSIPRN